MSLDSFRHLEKVMSIFEILTRSRVSLALKEKKLKQRRLTDSIKLVQVFIRFSKNHSQQNSECRDLVSGV